VALMATPHLGIEPYVRIKPIAEGLPHARVVIIIFLLAAACGRKLIDLNRITWIRFARRRRARPRAASTPRGRAILALEVVFASEKQGAHGGTRTGGSWNGAWSFDVISPFANF
jgi:hypothetical protein